MYKPEQLTPVQRQARDAVSTLRDSVSAAGGALARLSADVQTTSPQVLESRASTVVDRCAAAERQRTNSVTQLSTAALTTEGELKARKDMLKEMSKLKKSLDLCHATYQPLAQRGKGQEVRDYGPSRAKPILAGFQTVRPVAQAVLEGDADPVPAPAQRGQVAAGLSGERGESARARVNIVHMLWTDWAGTVLGRG